MDHGNKAAPYTGVAVSLQTSKKDVLREPYCLCLGVTFVLWTLL